MKWKIISLTLVFIVIALSLSFFLIPKGHLKSRENFERLKLENKKLSNQNKLLSSEIHFYKNQVDSLNLQMVTTNKTLKRLIHEQHQKIHAVGNLSSNALLNFFSEYPAQSFTDK